jgi:hypothetical protein
MKFISKHRVKDTFGDCYYKEDEDNNITSTLMYSLDLTDRFKYHNTHVCSLPRSHPDLYISIIITCSEISF